MMHVCMHAGNVSKQSAAQKQQIHALILILIQRLTFIYILLQQFIWISNNLDLHLTFSASFIESRRWKKKEKKEEEQEDTLNLLKACTYTNIPTCSSKL